MTDRFIFHKSDPATNVVRSLRGLVSAHPGLSLIPSIKTVFNAEHDRSKVSLLCGGGAGHEPGSTGFVGAGFLSASVSGDTFASPSARQVYGGMKAVPSDKGTILIITNYTGDNLHFGLACQQARADGNPNVAILPVCDDVSVGRTKGALVGRRALAGTILVCKILGAASQADWSFENVLSLGKHVTGALASIACTLGHCHVPERSEFAVIPLDTIEVGLGVHNEPGVWVVSPQPDHTELISLMLKYILDKDDPERSFVPFNAGDEVVLLVNNMGGLSVQELYGVVDETLSQLEKVGIVPARVFSGTFFGSLNAPGFSLSLLNISLVTESISSISELLELVDAPHNAAAWPAHPHYPISDKVANRPRAARVIDIPAEEKVLHHGGPKIFTNSKVLVDAIRAGATAVLNSEPDLTRWDTIVGDGDCGETCAAGSKAVLDALDKGLGADGELVSLLRELTEIIDDTCGGTLGAIFSIFLAALTAEVRTAASQTPHPPPVDLKFWGSTTQRALHTLFNSTKARVGHRTVMDALIPLVESLSCAESFEEVKEATRKGGEGTKELKAKLGRATYVGDSGDLPPDPGAMSLVALVVGMNEVLKA
ncbi:Dak1 domain-containing protein [Flagelloscypha sp. PMI_526]|nr:Dak1 domain-containing protein [Flagelloscypha sp. PMI_526]